MAELPCDPIKEAKNVEKHGISLQEARNFEFRMAVISEDTRFDYPERRWRAIGRIGSSIYFLVFARTDWPFRPISLREATPAEVEKWKEKQEAAKKPPSKDTKTTR